MRSALCALAVGGPDETRRIAALLRRSAELQESAEKLEGRCVPRPVPPVYFDLRDEVVRFVDGLASTARMLPLIEVGFHLSLCCGIIWVTLWARFLRSNVPENAGQRTASVSS